MPPARKDMDARAWFAEELKAHRASRKWTQADVAEKAGFSESLIAQVETCHKAATAELARELDRVFGTAGYVPGTPEGPGTPGTFGRLVVRLRNLPFPASFRSFAPHEAEAAALYTFEHSFIPGLFQTPDYARAVLEMFPDVTDEIVSERLAGRLSRQAILNRDDPSPPLVCALIDESALLREIGGPAVMRAQLEHLIVMSQRSNITVQVIPNASAHPGLLGAFTVAERAGSGSIVNVEDIADGRVTDDPVTVSMVALRFHSLRGDALSKGASRELIEGVIKEDGRKRRRHVAEVELQRRQRRAVRRGRIGSRCGSGA